MANKLTCVFKVTNFVKEIKGVKPINLCNITAEKVFLLNSPFPTLHSFYSNVVYKNIKAENHPIFKNIIRYCSASARIFFLHFPAVACFAMFISENHMADISHFIKKRRFLLKVMDVPLKLDQP